MADGRGASSGKRGEGSCGVRASTGALQVGTANFQATAWPLRAPLGNARGVVDGPGGLSPVWLLAPKEPCPIPEIVLLIAHEHRRGP